MKMSRVTNGSDEMSNFKDGQDPMRENFGGGAARGYRLSVFQILWNRRRIVSIMTVGCVLAFGAFALSRPKIYTRSCSISVEPVFAKPVGDNLTLESFLNTQAELISSSTLIHTIALNILIERQAKGLIALPGFNLGHDDAGVGHDLGLIRDGISAVPSRTADIITIQFNSPHSDEAAHILSAVAKAFTQFTSTEHRKPKTESFEAVIADHDKWEKEVHAHRAKLAGLESEITLLQMQEGVGNVDAQALTAMADELATARVRAVDAEREFERIAKSVIADADKLDTLLTTKKLNGVIIVPGHDEAQIKSELYAVRQRLKELKERYLPNHPAVVGATAKVDEIVATYVLYLQREWIDADQRAKLLEVDFNEQKKRSTAAARGIREQLGVQKLLFKEEQEKLDERKKFASLLEGRIKEASALDEQSAVNIHLLSEPDPKGRPDKVRPNIKLILLEGLLVGLVLGITLAFVDQRVRSVNEVMAATHLPVLGVIPHMPRSGSRQTHGRKVHLDPINDVSEAFRAVGTAVHFGPASRTVLVTSAEPSEGKSTLAANLGIAMAEAGYRVLLLDADLRDPTQHLIFSTPNELGVSSVIAGRSAIDRASQPTGIRNLDLMPCGPVPLNPSEAINNQMFADLLEELGSRYDYVIVDSPPVMAVTDARILGAMCDVTLLVVRADRTHRRSATDARDGLRGFGAHLLGIVINDGPRSRRRYGYYGAHPKRRVPVSSVEVLERPSGSSGTDLMMSPGER